MSGLRLTDYTAAEREAAKARALAKFGSDRVFHRSLGDPRPYRVLVAMFTKETWARYVDLTAQLGQQGSRLMAQELLLEPDAVPLLDKVPMAYVPIMTTLRALAGGDNMGATSRAPSVKLLETYPEGAPDLGLTVEVMAELKAKAGAQDLFLVRPDYDVTIQRGKDAALVPYGFVMRDCDAAVSNQIVGDFDQATKAAQGIVDSYREAVTETVVWASPKLNGSTSFAAHQETHPALIGQAWVAFLSARGSAVEASNKSLSF